MLLKDIRWNEIADRYMKTFALENHDRPVVWMNAPEKNPTAEALPLRESIEERWLDFDYVIHQNRAYLENHAYYLDGYPKYDPNLGPDIMAATLGADLNFAEHTSWAEPIFETLEDAPELKLNKNNKWYQKIIELTERAVADAKGEYIVGITDLHPGLDCLSALCGPENLCMDLYACPERIKKATFEVFEAYKTLYTDLDRICRKNQRGSSCWMTAWNNGRWYPTSCDFMCMISGEMFDDFIYDELVAETKWLDANIFHLDGVQASRHLDKLLAIDTINGIQWVPGAGEKPMSEWIDILQKIQAHNKALHIHIAPEEIETIAKNLKPEGLFINCWAVSDEQARYVEDVVTKAFVK